MFLINAIAVNSNLLFIISQNTRVFIDSFIVLPYNLIFRDHPSFDNPANYRKDTNYKKVSRDDESARGGQPIRDVGRHRCNEEAILPHRRAGLNDIQ